jgi:hypothetical protein
MQSGMPARSTRAAARPGGRRTMVPRRRPDFAPRRRAKEASRLQLATSSFVRMPMRLGFGASNLTRIFGRFDRARQSCYFFDMLGGDVGSIVSHGLERLIVLFDKYCASSHLFLHSVARDSDRNAQIIRRRFRFSAPDHPGQIPVFSQSCLGHDQQEYLQPRAAALRSWRRVHRRSHWPHCRSHAGVPVPVRLFRQSLGRD